MKKEGQIKVDSENLFPIIKKWLYSDKDIFLREIIANGCDAIKKYQSLCSIGETENDGIKPRIDVILDKDKKTLTVSDNGLGMTEDEVEKYITQVAFSGAKEFIEKYSDKTDAEGGIIGHFGLGFYSAYMVSDSVEIDTLSYVSDASPVHWVSDGSSTYEISDGQRTEKGTSVIMHLSEDGMEFCDSMKLRSVLKKYCHFMPYEIFFTCVQDKKEDETEKEEKPVNNTTPLWLKAPKDCTTEEYEDFYREVFPDINLPLFWIHLNVDYPFNLKGILYFPKQTDKLQVMPGEIKLFSNQVYIADNIKEVVPEFLMLLKGVIDCPDLPLNVSRSFLQNDGEVAKISKHITKKVADKLVSVFKNERKEYESYWDDISPFIKFGCIKDEKFYDRMKDIILYKTTTNEFRTFSEIPKTDDNKVYYVSDMNAQAQYIKIFKDNGIDAIILEHNIDTHFVTFLEYKESGTRFVRIDSDVDEALKSDSNDTEINDENIIGLFNQALGMDQLEIKTQALKTEGTPAIITINEYQRRINDMNRIYGDMFGANNDKAKETLIINTANPIVKRLEELDDDKKNLLCRHIYDLAVISQRKLTAAELEGFISRSVEVMDLI